MTLLVHEQSIFSHLFNIFGAITLKPSSSSVFSSREANLNFQSSSFQDIGTSPRDPCWYSMES